MPDKDAAGASPTWRDPKRYLWPLGLTIPLSPFLAWGLVSLLGPGAFWALGLMIMGIALPLVDKFAGVDRSNPPDEALAALDKDKYYRWCVYLFLPLQYAGLVAACYLWAHGPLGTPERIGLAVTVGVVGGVGINAAHELGHKRENVERWLSKVTLAQTLYGHFYVEHNHGHHLRVATPEDPASAKFGESFWKFLPRTMIHGLHSAWDLETRRLARSGSSPWTLRNNLFNAAAMSIVLFGALISVFGWIVLPYLLIQAAIAIVLYEAANYLEHYGLMRTRRPDGRYAKPSHRDSWNSDHLWSNLFLYHLQRHSDHHANPVRRYQALRTVDESPQLPAGYAVMIFCAMVPPLWRKVMDQRLMDFYDGDPSLVNVDRTDRTAVRRLDKLSGARAQS
ncbi:alkane 1-monooxygenase [Rhodococcus sp. 05-2254-5]|uniref:alkane 1-monooxygenase n=1 Tax=unclassified Rhodococcus (in: high G+C Gram-positive bacteria) TaxID=192944 RepID=UPI000B9B2AE2|nr:MULTISPECIES: alkane 1-monooxygenase [unclassified Rhodococcus (in: high G+C Gram-positive bacteria)]OZE34930.1 alkane 1-monooxygenase [Rhodococcus sp. 05-2254-5]OZE57321.1 alkane 1-monooxygenase [Rhodococcus sp. 05-2254-1]OZE57591.1 alkane 1-monooxygenase [Rhodococcus sp. 05-2254-1]